MTLNLIYKSLALSAVLLILAACLESNGVYEEPIAIDDAGTTTASNGTDDTANADGPSGTNDTATDETGNTANSADAGAAGTTGLIESSDTAGNTAGTGSTDVTTSTDSSGNDDTTAGSDESGTTNVALGTDDSGNSDDSLNDAGSGASTSPVFPPELLDNGRGAVYSQAVNSALLSGPVVGKGETPNNLIYKNVQASTKNFPADMQIRHAIAYESEPGATAVIWHLHNVSSEFRCFVVHGATAAYDVAGQLLSAGSSESGIAIGSAGFAYRENTQEYVYTTTCVSPGEIVYIPQFFDQNFTLDQIGSVEISDLGYTSDASASNLAVQPISYELSDAGEIRLLIANQSAQTFPVFASLVFYLTDEGVPIFLDALAHDSNMLPGTELITSKSVDFRGSSTKIRVVTAF